MFQGNVSVDRVEDHVQINVNSNLRRYVTYFKVFRHLSLM